MRIQNLKSRDDGECKGDLIYYSCVRENYSGCCLIDPCDANKYPTGCPAEYQSTKRPEIDDSFTMGPGAVPVGPAPPPSSVGDRWPGTTTIDGTLIITITTTPGHSPTRTPASTTTTTSFSTTTTPASSQPSSGSSPSTAIPTASTMVATPSSTPGGGLVSHGGAEQGKTGLDTGTIYGIIAGAAGLVTLIAVLAALLVMRYRRTDRPQVGPGNEASPLAAAAPNSPSDGGAAEERLKTPLERDPNLILHWRPPLPPRAITATEAGGGGGGGREIPRSATLPAPAPAAPPTAAVATPQPGRVYRPYRPPLPTRRSADDHPSYPPVENHHVQRSSSGGGGAVVSPVSPPGQSAPGNYAPGMSANWASAPNNSATGPSSPGAGGATCSCSSAASQNSPAAAVYQTGQSFARASSGSSGDGVSPAGPSSLMIHGPFAVATTSESSVIPQRRRSRPQTRYELDAINNQISELDSQVGTIAPVTTVKVLRATPRELEIRGPRRKSAEEAAMVA
ncbi:uncharacterized protein E0L32_003106 [Thyridium curvatum]|uniref:Uncharacterized protein n=1 Tax=Thyridium curvatum TaxID=1093900 RepID=A0A507BD43_9PEZI|nr:uncharacterized protein E0L32_003106 [Thyridium curvatum]TPX17463.1 hypothetical protein E0L32_003106 [Thyridium curvatum]